MKKNMTSTAILKEISNRIKQYRIAYPMTQKELSEKTGISARSITRFEAGEDIQTGNLIKILCALDLDDNLELLVPDPGKRPSYHLTNQPLRKRASSKKRTETEDNNWKWGDEK